MACSQPKLQILATLKVAVAEDEQLKVIWDLCSKGTPPR